MQIKNYFLGGISALFIFSVFITSLVAVITRADIDLLNIWQDRYFVRMVSFSFYQATLSTLLSIALAIPISLALRRRNFVGKSYIMRIFNVVMVLPSIIAVLALLSVYGNSGFINNMLNSNYKFSIYGLTGILLAHVFFNLPLAIRVFNQQLQNISLENELLALQLGMNFWTKFKLIEFYELKKMLFPLASLIFILCFTSFAIIMILGGGPYYSSLEVGIYEALHYNLDFNLSATLAIWQIIFCILILLFFGLFAKNIPSNFTNVHLTKIVFRDNFMLKIIDFFAISLVVLFLLAPLIGLVSKAINPQALEIFKQQTLYKSLLNSAIIAISAGILAMFLAINSINAKAFFANRKQFLIANLFDISNNIILILPSIVLATGLFLIFYALESIEYIAYAIVIVINALMALPLVNKILAPQMLEFEKRYRHLFLNLNISGFNKFINYQYVALKPSFREAFSFAVVLSLGDISAVALFGNQIDTLSLYLFKLMGSYKISMAWSLALLILLLCFSVFSLNKIGLTNYARSTKY